MKIHNDTADKVIHTPQYVWVDPPEGWRYGFPKIWNGNGNMFEWLVCRGYPQSQIDSLGDVFYTRQWKASEEEITRKL